MLLSLARSLTDRTEANTDSLEALFAGVRAAESEVEAALRLEDVEMEEKEQLAVVTPQETFVIEAPASAAQGEQLRLL
jgi:hypothetical protein